MELKNLTAVDQVSTASGGAAPVFLQELEHAVGSRALARLESLVVRARSGGEVVAAAKIADLIEQAHGHAAIQDRLMRLPGFAPDARGSGNRTPLEVAIDNRDTHLVRSLFQCGATPETSRAPLPDDLAALLRAARLINQAGLRPTVFREGTTVPPRTLREALQRYDLKAAASFLHAASEKDPAGKGKSVRTPELVCALEIFHAPGAGMETPDVGQAIGEIEAVANTVADQVANDFVVQMVDAQAATLNRTKATYGATGQDFDQFCKDIGAVFAPSASAGRVLASLNDHAGILIVPALNNGAVVAERLTVLTDTVKAREGAEEPRYFVKGYGDRVVEFEKFKELAVALNKKNDAADGARAPAGSAAAGDGVALETVFRSRLQALSKEAALHVRRDDKESDQKLMSAPPNPTRLRTRPENWANGEHAMPRGFGPRDDNDYFRYHLDYNAIENRLVIFENGQFGKSSPRKKNETTGLDITVNIDGPVLAEIHGIRPLSASGIEVMGPAGREPGVKFAALKRRAKPDSETTLRITTEDHAIHELVLGKAGARMRLVQPQPSLGDGASGAAFGVGPGVDADIDLYHYRGRYTGPLGTPDGIADSKLITSTGDHVPAAVFIKDRGGIGGNLASAGIALTSLPLLRPELVENPNTTVRLLNTAIKAVMVGLLVYGMNRTLNAMRQHFHPDTGTLFGGNQVFSSSGANNVPNDRLALAVACIVMAQELISVGKDLIRNVVPVHWRQTETTGGKFKMDFLLPTAEEFLRLLTTYGIGKTAGLPRGAGLDVATLAGASVAGGVLKLMESGAGALANHPWRDASLTTGTIANDMFWRSLGNVLSNPRYSPATLGTDWLEAVAARLITRGPDKFAVPVFNILLNAHGIIGQNAGAYDQQVARETRLGNAISGIAHLLKWLNEKGNRLVDSVAELDNSRRALLFLQAMMEHIKQAGNRSGLTVHGPLRSELAAAESSGSFVEQREEDQRRQLQELERDFTAMIDHAKSLEHSNRGELEAGLASSGTPPHDASVSSPALRSNTAQLPSRIQQYTATRLTASPEPHRSRGDGSPLLSSLSRFQARFGAVSPARPENEGRAAADDRLPGPAYPVQPSYDMKQRPVRPNIPRFFGRTERIPAYATTFSRLPQHFALGPHNVMTRSPGIWSINIKPELSPLVKAGIKQATMDYTVESQFFHYPLRWQFTGEPKHEPVAPGIAFAYNVMTKPGNSKQFDPIEALYINLGALHAPKFPANAERAVVTEAGYRALLPGEARAPAGTVTTGDVVTLTEILSATLSSHLAASFQNALGFGAAPKERNLRLALLEETAVNITRYTDLVQAELIAMPGALFTVAHIDGNAGRTGDDQDVTNIGQVVYMKRLNTYLLEENYRAYARYQSGDGPAPENDTLAVDPVSGHFFKFDEGKDKLQFVSLTKNYFLGTPLEQEKMDAGGRPTGEPSTGAARWRHPYTSDFSPRTTKDAIHAAILRGDPIVPHLDDATTNVHHEYFRIQGGYYETGAGLEELEGRSWIKTEARRIAADLAHVNTSTPLQDDQAEMLAWLTVSLLRVPIALAPVDAHGNFDPDNGDRLDSTYDKADLSLKVDGRPNPGVMVGVGPDGYYAIHAQDGAWSATRMEAIGVGKTAGNLLHAFFRASEYSKKEQYTEPRDLPGRFVPDRAARNSVDGLMRKLREFAAVDYLVLQRAMVDKWQECAHKAAAPRR